MRSTITPKAIRRIVAADGYLELNLPQKAVAELEKVGHAGPLEGPLQLLMGLAKKRAGHQPDAIHHLEQAARIMPKPARRFAWSELASCYRCAGSDDMAELAESLGGDKEYELRIALPSAELKISSTESSTEVI